MAYQYFATYDPARFEFLDCVKCGYSGKPAVKHRPWEYNGNGSSTSEHIGLYCGRCEAEQMMNTADAKPVPPPTPLQVALTKERGFKWWMTLLMGK